jgi:hypothetical protein
MSNQYNRQWNDTKKILYIVKRGLIKEEDESIGGEEVPEETDSDMGDDAIPFTEQDNVLGEYKTQATTAFGADFKDNPNPLIYYKSSDDIIFSGIVPDLNNMKFQFRYRDSNGEGCYIYSDPVQLTDNNISKINKIYGFFKNWRDSITKSGGLTPISYKQQ